MYYVYYNKLHVSDFISIDRNIPNNILLENLKLKICAAVQHSEKLKKKKILRKSFVQKM